MYTDTYIYFKNVDYKGNKQVAEMENSRGTYLNREVRGDLSENRKAEMLLFHYFKYNLNLNGI